MDMSIIEQLESIKAKCCGICKYLDAFEKNTMDCPDGMCQEEYLKTCYCDRCFIKEI
jgi:hypothetical protein